MTKKSRSSKQNETDHRPFRFQSLNDRLNNININVVHRIRYHERIDLNDDDDLIRSSHFHQGLEHWSTLNFSETFSKLHRVLVPLSGSLEQVIFNRDQIVEHLRQALEEQNPLVIESLLDLIVQFARDLQSDFYIYYKEHLFVGIVNLLIDPKKKQREINTELLEQVFQCLTYLFKYLWRTMLKDLANLYELYSKYFFSSSSTSHFEYIRSFAAESFAYLLRKIENYQPLIDFFFDGNERDENEIESLALLFSETCENVQSTFHSCSKTLLTCLLKKLLVKPVEIHLCLKRIYSLLIEHTNKENVSILWNCVIDVFRTIDNDKENPLISRTFYELIQLLIDRQMIVDLEICWKFFSQLKEIFHEEILVVHYETVSKVFSQIPLEKKLIDIYFRFVDQTSPSILYEQTKKLIEKDLKLSNEFYWRFWKILLSKTTTNEKEMIDYFVDFLLIERRKNSMNFHWKDNDETINEKIELINKKKCEKIPVEGFDFIRNFLQRILSRENLTNGELWRALILRRALPNFPSLNEEKISSSSSSIVAVTLLEFVCQGRSFSTEFWFSQLEGNFQSKIFLFATRVAFLREKPSNDEANRFFQLLRKQLSSHRSTIRFLTLKILSSFSTEEKFVIENCLACEQSPLNVYEYRGKMIFLQKLSVDFLFLHGTTSSFYLSMFYLFGLLASNFTPLWSISIELIGSYGNKALDRIGHGEFWSILTEKFQPIEIEDEIGEISDRLVTKFLDDFDEELELNEKTIDFLQFRLNLFAILNHFPNECEQKTKILLPIIFDFFHNEFYDHLLALGLFGRQRSSFQLESTTKFGKRLSRKISVKTLETILNLLKEFRHWHQWIEPERLYQFYVRLLLSSDGSIQQLAFQCLLNCVTMSQSTLREDFLPHVEKILPLFQASSTRKTFHDLIQGVLLDSTYSDSLKHQFAFLLIRILFSKLNEKRSLTSTTRGRKDYLQLNRKYLFQFLVTFASNSLFHEEFLFFIRLLVEPFEEELFTDEKNALKSFQRKLDENPSGENCYELFLKSLQHSSALLKTFLGKLGVYIQNYLTLFVRFFIFTIKFVDSISVEGKSRRLVKKLRSMSYKSLQTIFDLFDQSETNLFEEKLIDDLWTFCVRENYLNDIYVKNKRRDDIIHLIKLVVVWSRTSFLRRTILDDRRDAKDLLKYFIDLLKTNLSNSTKSSIIEIVWNLIQLDRNDPLLVPHHFDLLVYLTNLSNSMIDKKSSSTLTSQEFDLLLCLSEKEFSSDLVERLSSIFLRLLNGKKKNLNGIILKILQNLFSKLDDPLGKFLNQLPIFCLKIIQRNERIELMKIFQILIDRSDESSSKTLRFLRYLIELNSWNENQIDEVDYQRRLESYKSICQNEQIDGDRAETLCLFYHFLYELENSINDLSLREYAGQCLEKFLRQIPSYEKIFLVELRANLKRSTIRHEFLRHLSMLIDLPTENLDLIDLKRLKNSTDLDLDFFQNISHVQMHRRFRALKRLKIFHEEKNFRLTTIENFLLPIVCSLINDEYQEMPDEIVFQLLTSFSRQLSWRKFFQLFLGFFRILTGEKSLSFLQKRCLTKTISSIIDAFHFDLENQRRTRTIEKRLLPMIFKLLSENSFAIETTTIDEQRQQAVLLTLTCAVIATKLLVVFPQQFLEEHLSTIFLHLIGLLRCRIYSVRDQGRDCLCKCLTILGKRYLKYLFDELIAGLQRGYQHFVLLHTVHTLLIHISTLNVDFPIDSVVSTVVKLYLDDFFNEEKTEASKANEHENSSYKPSNVPEAKTNKTANVFELLGRLIRSNKEIFLCVEPLRNQLIESNDSRQISKCQTCLQRFQMGLIENSNLTMENLFIFVHQFLTKNDDEENSNRNEEKKMNLTKNERSQYHLIPREPKRGHARVAQAIKYGKKTNLHCFISWIFNFLHKLMKKFQNNADDKFLSMIDPFVRHIEISLHSPHTDVIVAGLRNLSSILDFSLPSLNKERVTTIYKKVFDLLKISSSLGEANDLLSLSYKILGIFVQRAERDGVILSEEEFEVLFTYIESDLLNVHRQSSAFLLLRSLMRHQISTISTSKNLRTLLDNLLRSRLMKMIVQSPFDHVRHSSRELFHIYLFSYEHSKAKFKSYLDFFLLHLDYEEIQGRLSVLTFLNTLFHDFPHQRLNDYAAFFFLPLSCHYFNETNGECQKVFQENLRFLLTKIDEQHRNDLFKNFLLTWLNDQIEHRALAVQLLLLFIEIEGEQFDQHLQEIFLVIEKELNEISADEQEEQQKFNDQYLYHLINVLVAVLKHCPNSLQMLTLRSPWLNLLKLVDEKCLLHPHLSIRFLSSQFFAALFDRNKPMEIVESMEKFLPAEPNESNRKRLKKGNLDNEPLFVHYVVTSISALRKIQRLCLCSCSQLKPSGLTEEFSFQVTKNLIYLSKILIAAQSNHFDLVLRRCSRLTTFESTKFPNEITRRSSILKWIAALIVEFSSSLTTHYKTFLTIVEREIERDETTTNLPLKILAQDVFDVFKRHCDLHLITSIYSDIAKQRRIKRAERKQKLAVLAINQPDVVYRKKRVKQTKRLGQGKKKRLKAIENAKKSRRKNIKQKTTDDIDDF